MQHTAATRWLFLSAPLGIAGACLPLALIYFVTGSGAGVLYLGAVCALLMVPMFSLALFWGYRLRVASAATPGWDDEQRSGLLKATLWITASVIPAFFAVAGLRDGVSSGDLLALALYSLAQYLGLRRLTRVYSSKLAQASTGEPDPASTPRPRLGLAYALIFASALLGCGAILLLYSGRLNEGALASLFTAAVAALGARRLLNVSRAV